MVEHLDPGMLKAGAQESLIFYFFFWGGGSYFGWVASRVVNPERHSRKVITSGLSFGAVDAGQVNGKQRAQSRTLLASARQGYGVTI